jgi:hypothetical protein
MSPLRSAAVDNVAAGVDSELFLVIADSANAANNPSSIEGLFVRTRRGVDGQLPKAVFTAVAARVTPRDEGRALASY